MHRGQEQVCSQREALCLKGRRRGSFKPAVTTLSDLMDHRLVTKALYISEGHQIR